MKCKECGKEARQIGYVARNGIKKAELWFTCDDEHIFNVREDKDKEVIYGGK